jgi:hypothetical protein
MRRKGKHMSLKTDLKIFAGVGILIAAVVVSTQVDSYLAYPVFSLIAIAIILSIALALVKLWPIHWLIRSAEWELMELVHRVETGVDSRQRKGEEKLDLFSRLARETQQVYTGPAQAGGHRLVGDLPQAPFRKENLLLINSQDSEMEKVSKRKTRLRLNAALLREILYGTASGYKSRSIKLTSAERETVMATIESLSRENPSLVWMAAKLFRHPSKIVFWAPKSLQGRQALDYLCHV